MEEPTRQIGNTQNGDMNTTRVPTEIMENKIDLLLDFQKMFASFNATFNAMNAINITNTCNKTQ